MLRPEEASGGRARVLLFGSAVKTNRTTKQRFPAEGKGTGNCIKMRKLCRTHTCVGSRPPPPPPSGTLEPHLSALLWVAMLLSLAIVIVLPQPHGVRALIASTILRLIFSVGLEPTLFLLGAFNVSVSAEGFQQSYLSKEPALVLVAAG